MQGDPVPEVAARTRARSPGAGAGRRTRARTPPLPYGAGAEPPVVALTLGTEPVRTVLVTRGRV